LEWLDTTDTRRVRLALQASEGPVGSALGIGALAPRRELGGEVGRGGGVVVEEPAQRGGGVARVQEV
jgi:hypothetical protein